MRSFFRKLLGRAEPTKESPEQAVLRVLQSLPECSSSLLVAGPTTGDGEYLGDVFVSAQSLLPWATSQANGSYVSDPERQAMLEVLPIWLRSANSDIQSPTRIPRAMADNIRPYISDFMAEGYCRVFCTKCGSLQSSISEVRMKIDTGPTHSDSIDEWYCPSGHLLYRARNHTHIVRPGR